MTTENSSRSGAPPALHRYAWLSIAAALATILWPRLDAV